MVDRRRKARPKMADEPPRAGQGLGRRVDSGKRNKVQDGSSEETSGFPTAPRPFGLGATLALVLVTTFGARMVLLAFPAVILPDATLQLLFLIAVLIAAVTFGFWTGLVAALLAFGALNYFFTVPLYTFHISRPQDLFALLVFLFVAALAGLLAGRLHDRAEAAQARAEALSILGALSSDLAGAETRTAALAAALRHMSRLCRGPAFALTRRDERVHVLLAEPAHRGLDPTELSAAERCLRTGRIEPAAAYGWPGSALSFLPVTDGDCGIALGHGRLVGREAPRLGLAILALAEQLRLALQRLDYAEKARAERLRAEAEATRSAVLTSLSHDLRTPLATILGAASALKELDASLSPAARVDLLDAIEEEASRMNQHVSNLLQMTRLELAAPRNSNWVDLNDTAEAAVTRARRSFKESNIMLRLAPDLPMIRAEGGLLEQALFNLIDNALQHGRAPVSVETGRLPGRVFLRVRDTGAGLSDALREWLAGPEMRPHAGQRGLGLAVAKGIARHLDGTLLWQDGAFTLAMPDTTEAP